MSAPGRGEPLLPTELQLERLGGALTPHATLSWVERLDGGVSCAMDVLATDSAAGAMRRLVLRRYRPGPSGEVSSVMQEAHALELARRTDVPAPSVEWIDHEGIFEEPALVLSFLEGEPPAGSIDTDERADRMAEALARIHSARLADSDYQILESYVAGQGDDGVTVPDDLAAHPLGPRLLERIRRLRGSLIGVDPCFVHGDYHPGNTLWSDDHLVGVVDWEIAGIADPAFDVAYCVTDMRYLGLDASADRFVATYRRISGHQLPNLAYWTAIALARAMPDVGSWLPAFVTLDPELTARQLRRTHDELVEELLVG